MLPTLRPGVMYKPVATSGGVTDPSAIAWLAAATGTYSDPQKLEINDLCIALKANGGWDQLDRIWISSKAQSQADALRCLKSLNSGSIVGSVSWANGTGFTISGSSNRINTEYVPSAPENLRTVNSISFGAFGTLSRVNNSGFTIIGARNGSSPNKEDNIYSSNNTSMGSCCGANSFYSRSQTFPADGIFVVRRNESSAYTSIMASGSEITHINSNATGAPEVSHSIGAMNSGGSVTGSVGSNTFVCRSYFSGAFLSTTQLINFRSAMLTFGIS